MRMHSAVVILRKGGGAGDSQAAKRVTVARGQKKTRRDIRICACVGQYMLRPTVWVMVARLATRRKLGIRGRRCT